MVVARRDGLSIYHRLPQVQRTLATPYAESANASSETQQCGLGKHRPVVDEERPAEDGGREERGLDSADEAFERPRPGRIAGQRD